MKMCSYKSQFVQFILLTAGQACGMCEFLSLWVVCDEPPSLFPVPVVTATLTAGPDVISPALIDRNEESSKR